MKILSIETSCDETAVSIIQATGDPQNPKIKILGNALFSQAKLHEKFGGVYPNLARREHAKNLTPLLEKALKEAKLLSPSKAPLPEKTRIKIQKGLIHENDLSLELIKLLNRIKTPSISLIAVTQGPGLEPALWVGVALAKTLASIWNIPILPVNHMEGHILSVLYHPKAKRRLLFPTIALLVSGGHTELVFIKNPLSYKLLGKTRDDAVGEAYDKVARMLGLPYPGGPIIASLAENARKLNQKNPWSFPRPMIHSKNLDFSFSGLKTSVLYAIKNKKLSKKQKELVSQAFEDAVTEVLVKKTQKALEEHPARSLILGGGVTANTHIRNSFEKLVKQYSGTKLFLPTKELSTDNSIMIGIAGYIRVKSGEKPKKKGTFSANGNLHLSS